MASAPLIRSFSKPTSDPRGHDGRRPVIFDILGPDNQTSMLPDYLKLVLHVNPKSMALNHTKRIERIQTKGGFVEQHWGDAPSEITFQHATGGFMRLYAGLTATTNPEFGGTRRETIAYDSYLDFLALFHNNGSIYDREGNIVLQGTIKVTFDDGVYTGWFNSFSVSEAAEKPYQFDISAAFSVKDEVMTFKTTMGPQF